MDLTKIRDVWNRFTGDGAYPHELSFLLDLPLRRLILSPKEHADRLHLSLDHNVLEIGPGSGYFSIEVARRLPKGRLELFDIQPEMLEKIRKKASRHKLTNIGYKTGDAIFLPYDAESFDRVYMVTVLGEVKDIDSCLKSIYRVLKKGGVLSVTEQTGDADHVPIEALDSRAKKQGFTPAEKHIRKLSYTANYEKK